MLLEAEGFNVIGEAADGTTAITETAAAAPRSGAARRQAARPRRLRRRRAHHRTRRRPGRGAHLQPRLVRLRPARLRQRRPRVHPQGRAVRGSLPSCSSWRAMLGLRRALLALFALGIIFAGLDVALVLASTTRIRRRHRDPRPGHRLSFIGTGLFAWWRRPHNRFGLLMTASASPGSSPASPSPTTRRSSRSAAYVAPLYLVLVIHMLLAFPTGAWRPTAQRATWSPATSTCSPCGCRSSCSAATSRPA